MHVMNVMHCDPFDCFLNCTILDLLSHPTKVINSYLFHIIADVRAKDLKMHYCCSTVVSAEHASFHGPCQWDFEEGLLNIFT